MSDELTTVWEDWEQGTPQPPARIRERVYWNGNVVSEFCVQLEYNRAIHYNMDQPAWKVVARFDHNISPDRGHDIRDEGLHMDLFPKTEHEKKVYDFPPVEVIGLKHTPRFSRDFLEESHGHYLGRFEKIVGVPGKNRIYDS